MVVMRDLATLYVRTYLRSQNYMASYVPFTDSADTYNDDLTLDIDNSVHGKSLLLTVLVLIGFTPFVAMPGEPLYLLIPAVLYIAYLVECYTSATYTFLTTTMSYAEVNKYLQHAWTYDARLTLHCECSHTEHRTRTTTDSHGKTTTRTETVNVVSYRGKEDFVSDYSDDTSGPFADMPPGIPVKVRFNYDISVGDQYTNWVLNNEKAQFDRENRWRDTHYKSWISGRVNGQMLKKIMAVDEADAQFSTNTFWWYSLFLLSVLYRRRVSQNTRSVKYTLRKNVYCRQPEESDQIPAYHEVAEDQSAHLPSYSMEFDEAGDFEPPTKPY